jgi:aminoglycoside phosphotransferase (APT) family kinase protein
MLHDAPLPPWPGRSLDEIAAHLDGECEWLVKSGVLPADVVTRNRRVAEAALRPWTPVFTHGDLQISHVFVDGDEITGVVDWSEAGRGDALYDRGNRPAAARRGHGGPGRRRRTGRRPALAASGRR